MADSLFDNRYRYDFIYPRGRSGETLRAVDLEDNERPVVIKRPAPNDAPPIRAGQEVSILNERKALSRLAGHPVLTELLGGGQFFSGNITHQYIVMERAEGLIIADEVLRLAAQGEYLPELEMLVIIDSLLDVLQIAHARDIVYNDVDTKHLFWSRDRYRLKLIDWGNAVFLEGDEVTPQGVSRANDIAQVGELLVFIVTGGKRAEVPRDAGESFLVDLGQDAGHVSTELQRIISKALHPNVRLRYRYIELLRQDLNAYRAPIAQERDTTVNQVRERLRDNLSKNDLRGLLNTLAPALALDPGHPEARQVRDDVENRLRDLEVSADLDAVRLYMEGGNWTRAADLLHELGEKAGTETARTVNLLLDFTNILLDANPKPVPVAVQDSIVMVFEGQVVAAARHLLVEDPEDGESRQLQWLLAERISSRVPEVLLLRPNLYRLDLALQLLADERGQISSSSLKKSQALLTEIQGMIDALPGMERINLAQLRDGYRAVVDRLSNLNKLISTISVQHHLSNRQLPLSSLDRAINAAMALADNMHVIGKQATASPRDATVALDGSRAIDPTNPLWKSISRMLNGLYELLQSYQTYVPSADGSDLEAWLMAAYSDLSPFTERLFDDMLAGMVSGLKDARELWDNYATVAVQGNRLEAVRSLAEAAEAVGTVSPTLAGWFNQLRSVVEGSAHVERHAIFGGLGRALADGWEAFDRGRLGDAERLGQQASDIARNEVEREAANRLLVLARVTREWVERSGVNDAKRTETVLTAVERQFTSDELQIRDDFARQMPSRETYLKAMGKGMVEIYQRSSTPALRLLFVYDVLLGALEGHDGNLEDAAFWRDATVRILDEERGVGHPVVRELEGFIERRREILEVERLLNTINGKHALNTLESTRRKLEDSPEARTIAAAIHSLRELEAGLRDWTDGEFRVAGLKVENAIKGVSEVEEAANITLTNYRAWLMELNAAAAELHTTARQMRQDIERRDVDISPAVRDAHHRMADVTLNMLDDQHAATLVNWRDTYESFLGVYTDSNSRRSGKLQQFNTLFRAMFIDRHPAYAMYRRWYDSVENAPEFPAPPTDDPTPRISEDEVQESAYAGSRYDDDTQHPASALRPPPLRAMFFAVLVLVLVVGAIAALIAGGNGDDDGGGQVQSVDSPEETAAVIPVSDEEETAEVGDETVALTGTAASIDVANLVTPTLITPTNAPSTNTPTTAPTDTSDAPTQTPTPGTPTLTPTATATSTPTLTVTPSITPTPTLPPNGLQGWQDLLALPNRLDTPEWDRDFFSLDATGTWRLGVGAAADADDIEITFSEDALNQFYGNDAPSRVRRAEATMALTTYIPTLIDSEDVYFGMFFQSADGPTVRAGIYVEVAGPNAVNLYTLRDENRTFVRQLALNVITPRIRLERNTASGAITVFFNEAQVGDAITFTDPEAGIQPVMFVQHGGVILNVTNWRVNLG